MWITCACALNVSDFRAQQLKKDSGGNDAMQFMQKKIIDWYDKE